VLCSILGLRLQACFPGFHGPEALAGRAFASGLASIQRNKVAGAGAKYRVQIHVPASTQNVITSLHLPTLAVPRGPFLYF
jgi:hypothetical protein